MMRIAVPLFALGCMGLASDGLRAQGPSPYTPPQTNPYAQPAFSPYLNLLRNNNRTNPALNYFGIVRPQINARNAIQNLEEQVNNTQIAASPEESGAALGSGHSTQFGNLSHYFPGLGTGKAAASPLSKPATSKTRR